jgi:hypothetical protein
MDRTPMATLAGQARLGVGGWASIVTLLMLAMLTWQTELVLISTLGIVVVAAGLFLPPRTTAVVGGLAIVLAAVLVAGIGGVENVYRLLNVVIGAALGMTASWTRHRQVQRIERLRQQEAMVLDSVSDAVALLDEFGHVVQTNQAMRALAPGVGSGVALHDLVEHRRADGSQCTGGCVLAGQLTPNLHHSVSDGDQVGAPGATRPVEIVVTSAADGRAVVSVRDLTQRLALQRARQAADEQRRLLDTLQRSLHPALPIVPGVHLDVWSKPSDAADPSGGDLAEVTVLPDCRLLLLLVDALGHGVASVRDAWRVLDVSRTLLATGTALESLVERAAAVTGADPVHPVATLVASTIDLTTGEVMVAGGGHPPALVVRATGSSQWLEAPGRGLGVPDPGSDALARTVLHPGDSLVLYTDGLVEATRDVIAGMHALRAAAVALRRQPTPGLARRLTEAALLGPAPDDAVVLLARWTGSRSESSAASSGGAAAESQRLAALS